MGPYIQIARIDHWFKNAFMLLGVLLAFFYEPLLFTWANIPRLGLAFLATCLIASSNYVLNELLDAPRDRFHPIKKHRPVSSGKIRPALALLEWIILGVAGLGAALLLNSHFAASGLFLWLMGVVYNVPPVRTKEWICSRGKGLVLGLCNGCTGFRIPGAARNLAARPHRGEEPRFI